MSVVLVLTGCAGHSEPQDRGTFSFVSPGGETRFSYNPPESRGTVGDFSGPSVTQPEKEITKGQYRGQALVLNVWGSWCGPCRAEMPELVEAAHATRDDPVQLLGVNVRDDQGAATDFLRNYDVPYPSLYDPSGKSMLAFDGIPLSVVPLTIVLDRHHRVAEVHLDTVSAEQLIPTLQRLATEQ